MTVFMTGAGYAQVTSVYTLLSEKACKTIESETEGAGWYVGRCPGMGGYKLELTEGDLRQSINVISPAGKKFELNFSQVSSAFSAVGTKAEWRVKNKKPVALIIRYNVNDQSGEKPKDMSFLIVTKITADEVCITDVVEGAANQNLTARKLADESAGKPCKSFD